MPRKNAVLKDDAQVVGTPTPEILAEAVARATAEAEAVARATAEAELDRELEQSRHLLFIHTCSTALTAVLQQSDATALFENDQKITAKRVSTSIIEDIRVIFNPLCRETIRELVEHKFNDAEPMNKHKTAYRKRVCIKAFKELHEQWNLVFDYSQVTEQYTIYLQEDPSMETLAIKSFMKALTSADGAGIMRWQIEEWLDVFYKY